MRKTLLACALLAGVMTPAHAGSDWYIIDFTNAVCEHAAVRASGYGPTSPAEDYRWYRNKGDATASLYTDRGARGDILYVKLSHDDGRRNHWWFPDRARCLLGIEYFRSTGELPKLEELR